MNLLQITQQLIPISEVIFVRTRSGSPKKSAARVWGMLAGGILVCF